MKKDELILPCLKGVMGDWVYYSVVMKFSDVASRIKFPQELYTNKKLSDMIQRSLKSSRQTRIRDYLLGNDDRFFGSLIAGSYHGNPQWFGLNSISTHSQELENVTDDALSSVGLIKFTGEEKFFALDGQHRLAGIREALKEGPKGLLNEELAVIFVGHKDTPAGIKRTRRLFISLNKHAVKVGRKDIIALDETDNYAILTRKLVEDYAPFTNQLIDFSGNTSIKDNDFQHITTITNLYDIVRILCVHLHTDLPIKKSELSRIRLEDKDLDVLFNSFVDFFDECFSTFSELKSVKSKQKESVFKENRSKKGGHLLFRPVGWYIFAEVIAAYLEFGDSISEAVREVKSAINFKLDEFPYSSTIWNPQEKKIKLSGKTLCRDVLIRQIFDIPSAKAQSIEARFKKHTGRELDS